MIRPARASDAPGVAAIYTPHVVGGIASFEEEPPDAAAVAKRMSGSYPWLVAEDANGTVVGYASSSAFRERAAYRWSVECGVYLAPEVRRRGIGRALYGALIVDLTARGFAQAFASIALPNPASAALHRAAGFRPTGLLASAGYKLGRWVDVEVWQRALAEPDDVSADPLLQSPVSGTQIR